MTYLILRFTSLGNVAMTVPVLASVSQRYPDNRFIVVASKRLSGMFHGYSNIRFHETDFQEGGLKDIIRLYNELKRYSIDAVIDLQDVLRTQILRKLYMWKHLPVYVIDYGRAEKHAMTLTGSDIKPLATEFERYKRTFHAAGLETDDSFTALPVNREALSQIKQLYGIKTGKWIGIAPFAKYRSNMLSPHIIKEIIQHYSACPDTRIYLFGAGEIECERLRQWAGIFPNVVSVAGLLPLEQELELMRQLDKMLCMDSANQHLASLVGLRAVSIWCGTHPAMGFSGWKQHPEDCIQQEVPCRPCAIHGTNKCKYGNYICQQIPAEKIYEQMEKQY